MIEINKIYNEDCLVGMQRIPDHSVDCIICDLPYGETAQKWDSIIDFEKLWKEYERVLKTNASVVLFASQPFTTKLISSNFKNFRYCWYWIKNQATNFFHAKRMPLRRVEEICVFYKGTYNPQKTDGHIPTNSAKGCSNGNLYYGDNKRDYQGGDTTRFPTNVLEIKCVDNYNRLHPNEKPIELLEYLVRTYSNEGDTILDNCMGSGTTAIACINTNRNFIGFETEKKYFDIANDRIKQNIQ